MATNFEFLFVSWIANLTESHLPAGSRVANANLLTRVSLVIPVFVKNPRFNIFSKNCEENVSKSEQFSSRPLSTRSCENCGINLRSKWREFLGRFPRLVKKKRFAFRVGTIPPFLVENP
jgi:hypothetical protein